jgi:hypothetical protein
MKVGIILYATIGSSALLDGCSSLPEVEYSEWTAPSAAQPTKIDDVPNTYELWTTSLEFKKDTDAPMSISVSTAPVSANPTTLTITGMAHWYKTTALTLSTAADSSLLTSVGVKVTDNRVSYITTAGEVLATVAPFALAAANWPDPDRQTSCAPAGGGVISVPDVADVKAFDEVFNLYDVVKPLDDRLQCSKQRQTMSFLLGNSADGVGELAVVTIEPPPVDAIEYAKDGATALKSAKKVFLYPACRNATVKFVGTGPITQTTDEANKDHEKKAKPAKPAPPVPVTKTVRFLFSDPRYLQAVPLPVQGSLTVKSECGVTSGTDSGTADSTAAVAKAIADSLQSVAGKLGKGGSSTPKTSATVKK